jgi:uridine phosphorylase
VDCLVDEQRPRLYRNVKNYGLIYYEWHQKGNVAIDTEMLKIMASSTMSGTRKAMLQLTR